MDFNARLLFLAYTLQQRTDRNFIELEQNVLFQIAFLLFWPKIAWDRRRCGIPRRRRTARSSVYSWDGVLMNKQNPSLVYWVSAVWERGQLRRFLLRHLHLFLGRAWWLCNRHYEGRERWV